ncbi:MAG: hypothetical protein H6736_22555 [Alphaproteobacteria bacterium]|nr:hypothetical protein [Alphaproteobacteria bacterium]MCB9694601.1 hypothetical protein [Alphaproteobacteria bacterium]
MHPARLSLLALLLPSLAHATVFTFTAPCFGEVSVDFGAATLLSDFGTGAAYRSPPFTLGGVVVDDLLIVDSDPEDALDLVGDSNHYISLFAGDGAALTSTGVPETLDLVDFSTGAEVDGTLCALTSLEEGARTLADRAGEMASMADDAYTSRFGAASLPDASHMESILQPAVDLLVAGGCVPEAFGEGQSAGAWGGGVVTGSDETGELTDLSYDPAARTFRIVLGDGTVYGGNAGTSKLGSGQLLAYGETSQSFIVGAYARAAGTRGVFWALPATCAAGVDPATVLDPWFRPALPLPPG